MKFTHKAGEVHYTAESLEDIAIQIDRMATEADREATYGAGSRRHSIHKQGEASAYRHVAGMLRNTMIKRSKKIKETSTTQWRESHETKSNP